MVMIEIVSSIKTVMISGRTVGAFSRRPRFGSVRLRFGGEGFERFRFSVLAVPLQNGFFCVSVQFNREGRFRFRFLENGSGGSGSAFGFGKNGSDGSGFRFRFGS